MAYGTRGLRRLNKISPTIPALSSVIQFLLLVNILDFFKMLLIYHGLLNPEAQCRIHKGSPITPILS